MAFPASPTNGQQTTQNGVVYTYDSTLTAWIISSSTTGAISASQITSSGNITGANFITAGLITATGNITGGNITTSGPQGNITGANVVSSITLSATGNVIGGNVSTAGLITATGNITGNNLNGAGLSLSSNVVSALNVTGNIAGGNITTPGQISVTGKITAGSVTTVSIPLVLDDISNQCDGAKMVFRLTNNLSNITSANITDSKNLQVAVNGLILSPWVNVQNFIWYPLIFAGFPTLGPGYQVNSTASSANVTFYRSPAKGSQVVLTIISNSSSAQVRKYPFTATYIALGV